MPQRNQEALARDYTWRETILTISDLATTDAEGSSISQGDDPTEILEAEIEDDNDVGSQLASYSLVRLGASVGQTGRSSQGKMFADFNSDESDTATSNSTLVRFAFVPKNRDQYLWTSAWYNVTDLDQSPQNRVEFPPQVQKDGDPAIAQDGRVLVVEAKNPSESFTIDASGSELRVPAQVGY